MFTLDTVSNDRVTIDVSHKDYLARQMVTGGEGLVKMTMKPRNQAINVDPAVGAVITSDDGNAILEIPPGAMTSRSDVRVTWLDPMPSAAYPEQYGQLPGPLLTHDTDGEQLSLSPLGFANLQFDRAALAPGAQATLRMKVNPETLKQGAALGMPVDFNNPASLQNPCYEYDRTTGLWVNPATSKLEQDSKGDTWFVYTVHGKEAPKNFMSLLQVSEAGGFITDMRPIRTPVTQNYYEYWVGGTLIGTFDSFDEAEDKCYERVTARNPRIRNPNCNIRTKSRTVYVDTIENIYGHYLRGDVQEQSSYGPYNNRKIDGAHVTHASDFFGYTAKNTDSAGNFRIPTRANISTISVTGSSWAGASSTGGGFNMTIPTDGGVKANVLGGSMAMTASTSNLGAESWTGSVSKVASRGSAISLAAPAAPLYLRNPNQARTGSVGVKQSLDLGTFTILKDYVVKVIEQVRAQDNLQQPNRAVDQGGVQGASLSGFTDYLTNATSGSTDGNGNFTFTLLGNAAAPTVGGSLGGARGQVAAPGTITLQTDSAVTLTLQEAGTALEIGESVKVTYTVDGVKYTNVAKVLGSGKTVTLNFARDKADNALNFQVDFIETEQAMLKIKPAVVAIGVADTKAQTVQMIAKSLAK